ncbi:MAG: hypothetical protein ABUK01_14135 [Leptospirales bacterium]
MKKYLGMSILLLLFNCNTSTKQQTEKCINKTQSIIFIESKVIKYHEDKILEIISGQLNNKSLQLQLILAINQIKTMEKSEEMIPLNNGKYSVVISENIDSKEDQIIRNYEISTKQTEKQIFSYEIKTVSALVFSNSLHPIDIEDNNLIIKIIKMYFKNRVANNKIEISFFETKRESR